MGYIWYISGIYQIETSIEDPDVTHGNDSITSKSYYMQYYMNYIEVTWSVTFKLHIVLLDPAVTQSITWIITYDYIQVFTLQGPSHPLLHS
jgi:hypothetical protein